MTFARSAAVQPGGSAAAVAAVPISVAPAITPAPMRLRKNIGSSLVSWVIGTLLNVDRYHLRDLRHRGGLGVWAESRRHPSRRRSTTGRHSRGGRPDPPRAHRDHPPALSSAHRRW